MGGMSDTRCESPSIYLCKLFQTIAFKRTFLATHTPPSSDHLDGQMCYLIDL